ncbi:hypothetical protein [Candidatus Viridilinea mediisalina]|uniref:Uncharacterized protein n=1 Tax=Candidatus Viridilinea mediisalina TaxID=2024553 RepID=A0A2A6RJZ8_9CHLR|nr:hypothetical protein [Candidatus Viridilinea mediisalina]PDW03216.1 hypothetical protein CJ255_09850 [Candidatus Viridilinea mediisalina]
MSFDEPHDPDVEASVRRIRRGCAFVALIFVSLSVLFVSATGNLFFLFFLIFAAIALAFSRFTR